MSTPPELEPKLWLSLEGRITRRTFWLYFVAPIWAFALLAAGLDFAMGAAPTNALAEAIRSNFGEVGLAFSAFSGPASNVAALIYIWPVTVGFVKRLHDINFSGWFYAAVISITAGSWAFFLMSAGSGWSIAIVVLAYLAAVPLSIVVYVVRGTAGPNTYGPDPLGRSESGDSPPDPSSAPTS